MGGSVIEALVLHDPITGAILANLPKPPTLNLYWRNYRGRMVIGSEGRQYRELVIAACRLARVPTFTGRLAVSMTFYPRTNGRADLDNFQKCILDSLQHGGCYRDDSQIDDLHIVRGRVVAGGRVNVRVVEIQAATAAKGGE